MAHGSICAHSECIETSECIEIHSECIKTSEFIETSECIATSECIETSECIDHIVNVLKHVMIFFRQVHIVSVNIVSALKHAVSALEQVFTPRSRLFPGLGAQSVYRGTSLIRNRPPPRTSIGP